MMYQKYLDLILGTQRDLSFERGRFGETVVEQLLKSYNWDVRPASKEEQLNDSFDFCAIRGGKTLLVEVKSEYKTARTGNIFLETTVGNNVGYLYKYEESSSIIFAYVFPHAREVWLTTPKALLSIDLNKYKSVESNDGSNSYSASGYLIPKRDLQKLVKRRYCYEHGDDPFTFKFIEVK